MFQKSFLALCINWCPGPRGFSHNSAVRDCVTRNEELPGGDNGGNYNIIHLCMQLYLVLFIHRNCPLLSHCVLHGIMGTEDHFYYRTCRYCSKMFQKQQCQSHYSLMSLKSEKPWFPWFLFMTVYWWEKKKFKNLFFSFWIVSFKNKGFGD